MRVERELAERHYDEHRDKPFFGDLVAFITGGPLVAMVLEGHEAVTAARQVIGATNPLEAAPGSIRGDLGLEVQTNLVHGSGLARSRPRARSACSSPSSARARVPEPLVLASRSPQRRAILEQLGIDFSVSPADVEEETHGEPRALVVENALRKARAVEGERVLGADTVVVLDGQVFGKPADGGEAETFLRRLSGRTHEVWGGIALRASGAERTSTCRTRVRFRRLEEQELRWYLETGEWRERAGGYAIQGRGAALVERIEGDFWNVVGLPVPELLRLAPDLARARASAT